MASTPRAQTFSGRRVQLDRAPLARPRVPERPGSPRCRSGSSRPGRCNVFDSGAAHECRLEDAEAYDFFETFPKSPSADKVAETEAATSSRAVHASFTVQDTMSKTVSRSQRYLPHGGLGLCIVVCWAFLANDRKAEVKRRAEREKQAVLDEKKTWLKSRTLMSMSPPEEQQRNPESAEYPEGLADAEEGVTALERSAPGREMGGPAREDYDNFLKDSKADRVLAPSEIFSDDGEEKTY